MGPMSFRRLIGKNPMIYRENFRPTEDFVRAGITVKVTLREDVYMYPVND